MMNSAPHVAILAGGQGQRLWPWSRRARPKQTLPLIGDDSLLDATLARATALVGTDRVHLVTGEGLFEDVSGCTRFVEREPRDTAPAIVAFAESLATTDPESWLLTMPSDHYIEDPHGYIEALREMQASASSMPDRLWLLGCAGAPDRSLGFIVCDPDASSSPVVEFVEKPGEGQIALLRQKRGLQNCGTFLMPVALLLEMARNSLGADLDEGRSVAEQVPSCSFDHFLLTRSESWASMMAYNFAGQWKDLGSWGEVRSQVSTDATDNLRFEVADTLSPDDLVVAGEQLCIRSSTAQVRGTISKQIVLLGVGPILIECSDEGVRICPATDDCAAIRFEAGFHRCQGVTFFGEGSRCWMVDSLQDLLIAVTPDLIVVASRDEVDRGGLREVLSLLESRKGDST